jgi:hypothetical protein
MEINMNAYTPDFSLEVQGVKGLCPAGEAYAKQQIAKKTIPVFSCEGPCIRGEIARLAANLVASDVPSLARTCHAEAFFVPHSSMAAWVKGAPKSVMTEARRFAGTHERITARSQDASSRDKTTASRVFSIRSASWTSAGRLTSARSGYFRFSACS